MQVVQTAALPPNQGRMRRAISGCTRNSRNDDRKMVAACSIEALSDLLGELRGEAGVGRRGEGEQALLRVGRDRKRLDEGGELAAVEPLAAADRLQFVVGVGDAVAAHDLLNSLGQHI